MSKVKKNNMMYLTRIVFLFCVLFVMFFDGYMMLFWIKSVYRLPLIKLVISGGEYHYTRSEDICRLIFLLEAHNTYVTLSTNSIQRQILCFPWIKKANIRKQKPNELKIHIVEYTPIARLSNYCVVDVNGHSFRIPKDRINEKKLPKLCFPEEKKSEALRIFCDIWKVLTKNKFILKDAIMTNRHSWRLTLINSIKLNFGRDDIMKRLRNFIELYPTLLQQEKIFGKHIKYIDLRYDSGAAVGWISTFSKKSN